MEAEERWGIPKASTGVDVWLEVVAVGFQFRVI